MSTQRAKDLLRMREEALGQRPRPAAAPKAPLPSTTVNNPEATEAAPAERKPADKAFVSAAQEALNSRFSNMYKAFQHLDLNHDGWLDATELKHALERWNLSIDDTSLLSLINACDKDSDDKVDYKEFVDMLARDTVANAAMGKRGLQAKDAMGVADLDREFLGHGRKIENVKVSK